ncbi:diphthamide biosynthesis protein 3, putative [Plasmodium malariae]|uniref:Diphthamide biosynthesis protein 3 n=1 Tax=Plasmodium malariae TaxID=5858 RepID=A0A1A8WCN5_PLAMA|nr:diphthamide biosynthesis protein 3, putative [Plasmodium malariae]SBS90771.1 zinc finger protein, putative [Plasmodium malariae]SCP03467.1 diphthamide biosynthesis protein 3, putative [Plasmodium malariae]
MIVENNNYEINESYNVIYEEVKLEDFEFDETSKTFFYPCPCGDIFEVTLENVLKGENILRCPSCSLRIKIIYKSKDLLKYV